MAIEVEQPSRKWPLIFVVFGALAIPNFFYKYSSEVGVFLLGLGLLCVVPQACYRPVPRFSKLLGAEAWKLTSESLSDLARSGGAAFLVLAITARWLWVLTTQGKPGARFCFLRRPARMHKTRLLST